MGEDFIGRQKELATLERAYAADASGFLPIYGRRRVGKSELILHFLEGKRNLYFLGKKAPAALQLREFLDQAAVVLDEPLLAGYAATGWSDALAAVTSRWPAHEKVVLVFDELQWTVESSPELPSILQEKWDREWRRSGNVLLILCGSYIGFMEREILGSRSPLFGRRTGQILLRPFGYAEAARFHPGYSLIDQARTYFICGGVPFYLRFFSDRRSVEANIAAEILDDHAALFHEPEFLLREELREVEKYHAVLLAVALGHSTNDAIARETGIGARSLHYYLQQLLELGYLARRYPLDGEKKVKRHVRYEVGDPLLRFWFRFVFPNMSYVLQAGGKEALRERIRPQLDGYFGLSFERLCREALPRLYEREGSMAAFEIGEYWSKTVQIDVVGLRDDGWTDLGECKWGPVRSPAALHREIEEKARSYPNHRGATVGLRLFTRRRPKKVPDAVKWHDLEELYS